MRPDLANWFEIIAAFVAIICWIARPVGWIGVLAIVLIITLDVEFTSKYLRILSKEEGDITYTHARYSMYSLFNIVKFCGAIWCIQLLLKDKGHNKIYLSAMSLITAFVIGNLVMGQGYKVYNNHSAILGILILVGITLWKLRQFDGEDLPKWQRVSVYLFLFSLFFYYTVNLPFFVFFQQMVTLDRLTAVRVYKAINGNSNTVFYGLLSIAMLLYTFGNRPSQLVQAIQPAAV